MRSDLIYTSTIKMSDNDWLSFRDRGLGASDISTVLHLNQYKSALELYHEKIGNKQAPVLNSFRLFMGHEMEDLLADYWEYWEIGGDTLTMMDNRKAGRKIRRMQKVNAYIQNPDFPHLFVSLDRKINKYGGRKEGALELKTISSWEAKKWVDTGVPLGYFAQVLTQILVCDLEYGELAFIRDFVDMDVVPIERLNGWLSKIKDESLDFWNRVEKGRILMTQRYEAELNFNMKLYQEIDAEISSLEPAVDDTDTLGEFLNDMFEEVKRGMIDGTPELLQKAIEHKSIKSKIKELSLDALLIENQFKQKIRDRSGIDFGSNGAIYWTETKNNLRPFRNRVVI